MMFVMAISDIKHPVPKRVPAFVQDFTPLLQSFHIVTKTFLKPNEMVNFLSIVRR